MRKIVIILAVMLLAGCASMYSFEGGENVTIVNKEPRSCEYKGDMYYQRQPGGILNSKEEMDRLYDEYVRSKAGKMGANRIFEVYVNRKTKFKILNFYNCQ